MPLSVLITGAIWGVGLGFPLGILLVAALWLRFGRQPRTITGYLPHPDYEQHVETQPSLSSFGRHTSSVDVRSVRASIYPSILEEEKREETV